MKKLFLLTLLVLGNLIATNAQNDTVLYIENCQDGELFKLCLDKHQRVLIYAENGCDAFEWVLSSGVYTTDNPVVIDSQFGLWQDVTYYGYGCIIPYRHINFRFEEDRVPSSFTHNIWKHDPEELLQLEAVGVDSLYYYSYHWSTGETTRTINVTEPGSYTCEIIQACGIATRTFVVLDNVEIYRATVDLATGLNKVTWQTTPQQAQYISQVKVERDGLVVGTMPYADGQFMDNIGSENAARNYRLIAITPEGTEGSSFQKGTLHVDYSPNANDPNKINMAWTPPYIEEGAPLTVTYFQICKYDPATGEVTVIDQIGANSTIASYDVNLFNGGYATVAALFNEGRDYEEMSFSNLTEEILGVGENGETASKIYPNPAKDRITIEGRGTMTVTNTLGQTILTQEIDGKATIDLPQGLYFVKLGNETQKIVVE